MTSGTTFIIFTTDQKVWTWLMTLMRTNIAEERDTQAAMHCRVARALIYNTALVRWNFRDRRGFGNKTAWVRHTLKDEHGQNHIGVTRL